MAQVATTFSSYDAVGIREDLSDLISDISPTEVPFQSNIGSESTGNTFFEWQTDALASAADNAQVEGEDYSTFAQLTATTRLGNYTQILAKDFLISNTEQAVNKAGRADERGYQAAKAGRELRRDWEKALLNNKAAAAGDDTTARVTGGLVAWIKSNVNKSNTNAADPTYGTQPTDTRSDGEQRAFTETILKDVVKQCWDAGADPSMLMVGSFNKQQVSGFSGIAGQRFMLDSVEPGTIIGAADIYLSDFGELAVVPNRFQRARDGLVLDPTMARVRTLRGYTLHNLAKTGDAEKFLLNLEAGLQVDNEKGFGIAADLTTS